MVCFGVSKKPVFLLLEMTSELEIAKYREGLQEFITSCRGELTPVTSSRVVKAREKLCKLTRVQFIDLSIDVYDELQRRKAATAPKHLQPQVGYHPKRNQARQKLSALPQSRFKDLVNDVLFEIDNRLNDGSLDINDTSGNIGSPPINHSKRMNLQIDTNAANTMSRDLPEPISETPTQLKSANLVPKKSELNWSSDEEEDSAPKSKGPLYRSPSTRVTIATNEVLNAHSGPDLKFPVDGDVTDDSSSHIQSKITQLEIENSIMKKKELDLEEQISNLRALEDENKNLHEQIDTLTSQTDSFKGELERYKNLESLESEYQHLTEKHQAQTEELEHLKKILDDHENSRNIVKNEFGDDEDVDDEPITENERELTALKAYLEKVLEQNESLKNDLEEYKNSNSNSNRDLTQNKRQSDMPSDQWMSKYEDLKNDKTENYFKSIDGRLDSQFFDVDGIIDVKQMSKVYSSLDTILHYLSIGKFESNKIFDLVATFAVNINNLLKLVNVSSGSNALNLDEKKLLLNNAVSNLLETTRHYSQYHTILPQLVMSIALNDAYFLVCDIVKIVKLKSNNGAHASLEPLNLKNMNYTEDHDDSISPVEENTGANYTKTPEALRLNTSIKPQSPLHSPTAAKPDLNVRPLKISQRLNGSRNNLSFDAGDSSFDKTINDSFNQPIPQQDFSQPLVNRKLTNSPIPLQMSIVQPGLDTSPVKSEKYVTQQSEPQLKSRDSLYDRMQKLNSSIEDQSKTASIPSEKLNGNDNPVKESLLQEPKQSDNDDIVIPPRNNVLNKSIIGGAVAGAATAAAAATAGVLGSKKLNTSALDDINSKLDKSLEEATDKEPIGETVVDESASEPTYDITDKSDDESVAEQTEEPAAEPVAPKELPDNGDIDFNQTPVVQSKEFVQATKPEEENPFLEKKLDVPIKLNEMNSVSPIESEFDIGEMGNQSALVLDEDLQRRVSKRLSKRLSMKNPINTATLPVQKEEKSTPASEEESRPEQGHSEEEESEVEEEDDFDVENFDTLNPDNTLKELLSYLEHQTVEVINAIQKTLASIKNPEATKGLLREGAQEINSVVKAMTEGTSTLMNQSRYADSMGHAKYVVDVLNDCVSRMGLLYDERDLSKDHEFAGKNFKQRSAGIAFDVARSTKELVKTVEEASLMDEIAVLDSRLNTSRLSDNKN